MSPAFNKEILVDRAKMLSIARLFFSKKNILEVDVPALSKYPAIDTYIEVMDTMATDQEKGYLHTSPEYLMKRLLSEKIGDIYYLGHVFRKSEMGDLHNVEFTMAEWYRKDIKHEKFIKEVIEFINLFLPNMPITIKTYRETFFQNTGIDYLKAEIKDLKNFISKYVDIDLRTIDDKDTLLNIIMTHLVEPNLGENELFVLNHYPASQASLAKTETINGEEIAKRFEIYYKGIELANGFEELEDPIEQKKRFNQTNELRIKLNKAPLPIDKKFIAALKKGFGKYCGVAVGFDRLFMLKHKKNKIEAVIPFSWNET